MKDKELNIEDRMLDFAVRIGKLVDALPETRLGGHIADQLIRSGTSPAPNYSEASATESKNDFIRILEIVLKELRESRTWIRMIKKADLLKSEQVAGILDECDQLGNIIGQSLISAKGNQDTNK